MSDLISRQAAIDALEQIFDRCEEIEAHLPEGDPDRTGYKMYPDYMTVWKYLHQLPSAQPDLDSAYTEGYTQAEAKYRKMWDEMQSAQPEQQWIPCKTRLPEEYGEYRITWVTSAAPGKRFIADAEFEVTSVWDNEHNGFEGEWLLDDYIENYPDVEVLAWKPIGEPWKGEQL